MWNGFVVVFRYMCASNVVNATPQDLFNHVFFSLFFEGVAQSFNGTEGSGPSQDGAGSFDAHFGS